MRAQCKSNSLRVCFRSRPRQTRPRPIKTKTPARGLPCLPDVIELKAGKSGTGAVHAAGACRGRHGGHSGCSREELWASCFATRNQVVGRARTIHDVQEPGRTWHSGEVRLVLHADDLIIRRSNVRRNTGITVILSLNKKLVKKPAPVTGARIR